MQTLLISGIAVAAAYASSYSSNLTPSLGISICQGVALKRQKIKKRKRKERKRKEKFLNEHQ